MLRPAQASDAEFLFDLRNTASVRKSAFQENRVEWEGHLSWFKKKLDDKKALILIAELHAEKIGQIRLDCSPQGFEGEIDIAVAEKYHGHGFGKSILISGCEFFFQARPSLMRLIAYVKLTNAPSLHSFYAAGFGEPQEVRLFDQACVKLTLTKHL